MSDAPRMISPVEARSLMERYEATGETLNVAYILAHTAAVLGEQREAVLALHSDTGWGFCRTCLRSGSGHVQESYPCSTARAAGGVR